MMDEITTIIYAHSKFTMITSGLDSITIALSHLVVKYVLYVIEKYCIIFYFT